MKVDLFVSAQSQSLPYTSYYGLIESINFIPTLNAFWYSAVTGKSYEIVNILQTRDRTIAICIERVFDVQSILSIPSAYDAPDLCYPSCPSV